MQYDHAAVSGMQGPPMKRPGSASPAYNTEVNNIATHRAPFDHIPMAVSNGYGALAPVMEEEDEAEGTYDQIGNPSKRLRQEQDVGAQQ